MWLNEKKATFMFLSFNLLTQGPEPSKNKCYFQSIHKRSHRAKTKARRFLISVTIKCSWWPYLSHRIGLWSDMYEIEWNNSNLWTTYYVSGSKNQKINKNSFLSLTSLWRKWRKWFVKYWLCSLLPRIHIFEIQVRIF